MRALLFLLLCVLSAVGGWPVATADGGQAASALAPILAELGVTEEECATLRAAGAVS